VHLCVTELSSESLLISSKILPNPNYL